MLLEDARLRRAAGAATAGGDFRRAPIIRGVEDEAGPGGGDAAGTSPNMIRHSSCVMRSFARTPRLPRPGREDGIAGGTKTRGGKRKANKLSEPTKLRQ